MSNKDIVRSTSPGTALVPYTLPAKEQFQNYTFIRKLRPDDATSIVRLISMKEQVDEVDYMEAPKFGVFNIDGDLVGTYETSGEAFADCKPTPYLLYWFQ